ncbi:MAG: PRC-barrel domain-containing protein [Candidatus Marsarchaeota archaeon]|nr:PRC-barrel domain-containing protein [Candidatus Marsarchaeota archaeon]MCL5094450.1 PRC-barrel domain-containing protein [Candidatus Marsarchaeota archaeon]
MKKGDGVNMRISTIYNMDIYSDAGSYLGEVRDAIIDLEKGEVSRLLMIEWKNADNEEMKKILQNKSVLFKNIKNIGDVVLVSSSKQTSESVSSEASELSGHF